MKIKKILKLLALIWLAVTPERSLVMSATGQLTQPRNTHNPRRNEINTPGYFPDQGIYRQEIPSYLPKSDEVPQQHKIPVQFKELSETIKTRSTINLADLRTVIEFTQTSAQEENYIHLSDILTLVHQHTDAKRRSPGILFLMEYAQILTRIETNCFTDDLNAQPLAENQFTSAMQELEIPSESMLDWIIDGGPDYINTRYMHYIARLEIRRLYENLNAKSTEHMFSLLNQMYTTGQKIEYIHSVVTRAIIQINKKFAILNEKVNDATWEIINKHEAEIRNHPVLTKAYSVCEEYIKVSLYDTLPSTRIIQMLIEQSNGDLRVLIDKIHEFYEFNYYPSKSNIEKLNKILPKSNDEEMQPLLTKMHEIFTLHVYAYIKLCEKNPLLPPMDKKTSAEFLRDSQEFEGDTNVDYLIERYEQSIAARGIPYIEPKLILEPTDAITLKNYLYDLSNQRLFQEDVRYAADLYHKIISRNDTSPEAILWTQIAWIKLKEHTNYLDDVKASVTFMGLDDFDEALKNSDTTFLELLTNYMQGIPPEFLRAAYIKHKTRTHFESFLNANKQPKTTADLLKILNTINPAYLSQLDMYLVAAAAAVLVRLNQSHWLSLQPFTPSIENFFIEFQVVNNKKDKNFNEAFDYQYYEELTHTFINKYTPWYNQRDMVIFTVGILSLLAFIYISHHKLKHKPTHKIIIINNIYKQKENKPAPTLALPKTTKKNIIAPVPEQSAAQLPAIKLTDLQIKQNLFSALAHIDKSGISRSEIRAYDVLLRIYTQGDTENDALWHNQNELLKLRDFITQLTTALKDVNAKSNIIAQLTNKLERINGNHEQHDDHAINISSYSQDGDQIIGDDFFDDADEYTEIETDLLIPSNLLPTVSENVSSSSSSSNTPVISKAPYKDYARAISTYLNTGQLKSAEVDEKLTPLINRAYKYLIINFFRIIQQSELQMIARKSAIAYISIRNGLCHDWDEISANPNLNTYLQHILFCIEQTKHEPSAAEKDDALEPLNQLFNALDLYEIKIIALKRKRKIIAILNPEEKIRELLNELESAYNSFQDQELKELLTFAVFDIIAQIGETIRYAKPKIPFDTTLANSLMSFRNEVYHSPSVSKEKIDQVQRDLEPLSAFLNLRKKTFKIQ